MRSSSFLKTSVLSVVLWLGLSASALGLTDAVEQLVGELLTASEGTVVQVGETGMIFVEFDRRGGVSAGSTVELIRQGEPIRAGNQIIGYQESSIGMAEIINLTRNRALARVVGGAVTAPLPGDKVYAERGSGERTVVAPLSYRQGVTEFSLALQERLVTTLVRRGLPVVERSQLERILQEQQLSYSGLFDIGSAQEVGRLLGAELMLLGTINDQGNTITLNTRLVDLGTASIVAASVVEVPKTPLIAQGLDRIEASPTAPTRGRVRRSEPEPTPVAVTPAVVDGVFENEWIRLEVNSIIWDEEQDTVTVLARITNITENRLYLAVSNQESDVVLFDEFGITWIRNEPVTGIRTYRLDLIRRGTLNFRLDGWLRDWEACEISRDHRISQRAVCLTIDYSSLSAGQSIPVNMTFIARRPSNGAVFTLSARFRAYQSNWIPAFTASTSNLRLQQ